jgi:hypothetical protein
MDAPTVTLVALRVVGTGDHVTPRDDMPMVEVEHPPVE